MGCGGLIIDTQVNVLASNATALQILGREASDFASEERPEWQREALKRLFSRADTKFRIDQEAWITVQHEDGAPLVLHAIPLTNALRVAPPDGRTMLVMVDLRQRPRPSATVLQRLFDLTPAEARLALALGSGLTLQEVSDETGLSNATLRSQLSSTFHKTGTRRQPELIALLARVAILP
ncbi:helix-turn-helix transcriptional regulator [Methylobacterium sp. NFXW15]|uniref:helix-turn-helix transcriptional regulator n=1 Tax=Methylobacterium sp. NFXW15 TaxID=2819512 RepID=UPI003CE84CCF